MRMKRLNSSNKNNKLLFQGGGIYLYKQLVPLEYYIRSKPTPKKQFLKDLELIKALVTGDSTDTRME